MKVVLSRKGMDSRAGGIPSPILPDGTLLSLPIPNEKSGVPYGDLVYKGRTYQQIIQQIHPTFDFQKHPFCHLDPDIYGVLKNTNAGWKPAFGQYEIPAKHLDGQGVDVVLRNVPPNRKSSRRNAPLQKRRSHPAYHLWLYGGKRNPERPG